jgi:hypothetical protein
MNRVDSKKIFYLFLVIIFGFLGTRCAAAKEELHAHGDMASVKTYPKDYLHPITETNFEKAVNENRGLKVVEENATTVHDYYRGGIQEKAEGEKLLGEGRLEEAQRHLEKSNRFFLVVLRYLPEDEAYKNIYGDHTVIFLPNLLMADNYLKLITLFQKIGRDDKAIEAKGHGNYYLSQSLKNVKTEWAFQIQKGFEAELSKK